jgi:hypothetical protein
MKRHGIGFAMLGAFLGFMIQANLAFAQPPLGTPPTLPKLTAEWWQWALSIPTSVNPLQDTTGGDCMVGQRDVVWFLAGTFSSTSASRNCSVPGDATLFFPIANSVNINTPNICGQGGPLSVAALRMASKMTIDGVNIISVTVDGMDVKSQVQRIRSEVFEVALPPDNLFNAPCAAFPPPGYAPAGIYSPAVDDGYYLLLQPLAPGRIHAIQFTVVAGGAVVQDITYNVTVVPVILQ